MSHKGTLSETLRFGGNLQNALRPPWKFGSLRRVFCSKGEASQIEDRVLVIEILENTSLEKHCSLLALAGFSVGFR